VAEQADIFQRPRRFYKSAEAGPADGGFAVLLDGRAPRSPAARPLVLPTRALAALIAEEWVAQGETVAYGTMPATRLAHTALDGVPAARAETAAGFTRFAAADLILYFAEAPGSLVARQEAAWGPLVAWAERRFDLAFVRATGITHRPQPPTTLARVETLALQADDFELAALAFGAALFGSAILALALRHGRLDGPGALAAARLDEAFQEERWGVDAEAAAAAQRLAVEAVMLERWFAALA
jgi:chaperone required for assembly of F1-ATPase